MISRCWGKDNVTSFICILRFFKFIHSVFSKVELCTMYSSPCVMAVSPAPCHPGFLELIVPWVSESQRKFIWFLDVASVRRTKRSERIERGRGRWKACSVWLVVGGWKPTWKNQGNSHSCGKWFQSYFVCMCVYTLVYIYIKQYICGCPLCVLYMLITIYSTSHFCSLPLWADFVWILAYDNFFHFLFASENILWNLILRSLCLSSLVLDHCLAEWWEEQGRGGRWVRLLWTITVPACWSSKVTGICWFNSTCWKVECGLIWAMRARPQCDEFLWL
jgi:hypothetical protein